MHPLQPGWNHGFHTTHGVMTPAYQGESGLCNSPDPLEEPTVDGEGRGHGVWSTPGKLSRQTLQHRWGALCEGKPTFGHWSKAERRLPHQLLGNVSSLLSLPVFPAGPNRTPCADSLRQHVCGVLYKSPGSCLLEAPLYSGRAPSGMGSAQPALAEGSTPAGQTDQGADMLSQSNVPSEDGCSIRRWFQKIWKIFGKAEVDLFASKTTLTAQFIIRRTRDALAHDWPNLLLYAFPPIALLPQVGQACQGTGSQGAIGGPLWREPTLVVRADSATDSSPLARALRRDLLSQVNGTIWPLSTRAVGSLHLAAQREPTGLPERVLTPFLRLEPRLRDASTPLSGLFSSTWCLNRGWNPSTLRSAELAVPVLSAGTAR